jgi:DNA-binding CsgD family transcriptional regulator
MSAMLYPALMDKFAGLGRRGQVLACIWAGRGTKEIAAELGISPKTVEYHRARLYQLFGVNDPVSLCRRAMAMGLIEPETGDGGAKVGTMPEAMPEAMPAHAIQNQNQNHSISIGKKGIKV